MTQHDSAAWHGRIKDHLRVPGEAWRVRYGIDGPNRHRWFTELNSMVICSSSLCKRLPENMIDESKRT